MPALLRLNDSLGGAVQDLLHLGHVQRHLGAVRQEFLGATRISRIARAACGARAVALAFGAHCQRQLVKRDSPGGKGKQAMWAVAQSVGAL